MPKISVLRSPAEMYVQRNKGRTISNATKKFIAYDGEGITVDGEHKYVLLMSNVKKPLIDIDGISTFDGLTYLCDSVKENPHCIHVCYGASYDINMLLRDVPYNRLKALQKGEKIGFLNFTIEYRQHKSIEISRYKSGVKHFIKDDKGKWHSTHTERITLWDVLGFFQGSFVKALTEFFPTKEEQDELHLADIIEGKLDRGTFSAEILRSFVVPYTEYEVRALVRLMDRLREYCQQAGISLSRYDGAGAIAAALLSKFKVKQYYGKVIVKAKKLYSKGEIPPQVMLASQHAFAAGRIEQLQYGHVAIEECNVQNALVYKDDIRSAYPSIYPELYDLSNGYWKHHNANKINLDARFSLFKVFWHFPDEQYFYPFFYRDIGNVIRFPRTGYNWLWGSELITALKWQAVTGAFFDIREQWEYLPESLFHPYEFVEDLYLKRLMWKQQGIGAQIPMKLGLNSFYGKTVQRLGYEDILATGGKLPPFFQLQYGGYITASVRAKMYDAAMQSPQDIIAFATDALWSLKRLDLPRSTNLGQWEDEILTSFTGIQAGVYFSENLKGEYLSHYRGFSSDTMHEEIILLAWLHMCEELPIKTKRFITLGSGITSIERYRTKWRQWEETDRNLRLKPRISEKRYDNISWTEERNPARMLLRTKVSEAENIAYTPYNRITDNNLSLKHILPWEAKEATENVALEEAIKQEIWESDT